MPLPTAIAPNDPGHIADHDTIGTLLAILASPFTAASVAQGTHAARPAAGTSGRLYYETDTGAFCYDTGAAWLVVNSPDINRLLQVEVLTDSTPHALGTSDAVIYTLTAALPSGWTSFDLYVIGLLGLTYVSGSGFRRVSADANLDGTGMFASTSDFWEDIAGSGVNRPKRVTLLNSKATRTASATVAIHAHLDSGSGNVSATDITCYALKLRRS